VDAQYGAVAVLGPSSWSSSTLLVSLLLTVGCVQGHRSSARPDAGGVERPSRRDAGGTAPDRPDAHDGGATGDETRTAGPGEDGGARADRDGAVARDKPAFDAGTDPDRNAVDVGSICDRLATLQCAAEATCCDAPGRTQAACKQAMKSRCDMDAMADAVAARSEAAFDADRAEQVFAQLERSMGACDPEVVAYGASRDGLGSLFAGTVAADGDCTPDNPLNAVMGGAALVACAERERQACLPSVGRWTCTTRSAIGGKCFSDDNCEEGAYCDNPMLDVRGSTCKRRKPDGSACALTTECRSLFCHDGECVAPSVQLAYCLSDDT